MTAIERPEVWRWLVDAVQHVHAHHEALWTFGVGERARVAQILLELRKSVPSSWDVDCEYNREESFGLSKMGPYDEGYGVPDLIVHHRGGQGPSHNLLVAEFKNGRGNLHPDSRDFRKVASWRQRFGYQFGAVVSLGQGIHDFKPQALWFSPEDQAPAIERSME